MGKMQRFNTYHEYISSLPNEVGEPVAKICSYILEAVPEAESVINYATAALTLVKDGKMDKQIMVAGYKNHIGFYPHPTTIEYFADELREYSCSKGTVQFPLDKPLPKDLIIRMVKYRKSVIDKM